MAVRENVTHELTGRFKDLDLGKTHLSVRWEPGPRIVRVGACIENYDWEHREAVIDALLEFEDSHDGEFAVEFDVIPHGAVTDPEFAEA
jgi:hypothetical protein